MCGCAEHAKDGGVPRVDGMANEEERERKTRTRFEHEHLIQHAFVHGHRPGVIPLKHAFSKRFEFIKVSSGTRS